MAREEVSTGTPLEDLLDQSELLTYYKKRVGECRADPVLLPNMHGLYEIFLSAVGTNFKPSHLFAILLEAPKCWLLSFPRRIMKHVEQRDLRQKEKTW